MDELTPTNAYRELSRFGLGALFLACRHGRLPELVASTLDDQQARAISRLLADPQGRRRVARAVHVELDLRTRVQMH